MAGKLRPEEKTSKHIREIVGRHRPEALKKPEHYK